MQPSLWHLRQTSAYWQTPSGQALLGWEQRVFDAFAERVFGFYALSFELGGLHTTEQSTIGHVIRLGAPPPVANGVGIDFDIPIGRFKTMPWITSCCPMYWSFH
jgi:hypothetical protein